MDIVLKTGQKLLAVPFIKNPNLQESGFQTITYIIIAIESLS
jgi:hypothetical protein